jgi:Ca2+-binding EF-hand superfamily protein
MSSIGSVGGFRPPPPKPPSFEKLDSDSNGSLSLDEFKSGAPKGADSAKTEELFKSIDSDDSGSISKDESDAFKSKAEKAQQQLQSFLFGLQSNSTEKTSDSTSNDKDDIFGKVDADSSGSVSKDEFLKAFSADGSNSSSSSGSSDLLSKLFDAIDSDSDGSISKDEQKAFQKAAQDRGPPPPPPSSASFGASQAYGSASQLGSQNWFASNSSSNYSQAA